MGQAKKRGTLEQRTAAAKERGEALRPANLICGSCEAAVTEFESMDTRGMAGIRAGFAGICPACGDTVFALSGEPEAVAEAIRLGVGSCETGVAPS